MEYCADKYDPEAYAKSGSSATDPLVTEGTEWVVRGGNYTSDAADLRCASRDYTKHEAWLKTRSATAEEYLVVLRHQRNRFPCCM